MTTFRQLQDEVLQILHGYGLEQPRVAFLSGSITSSATSITVADASDVQQGIIEIENELIYVQSVNRDTNTLTVSADGRGFYGTTAAAHSSGVRLTVNPTWTRNRVKQAINNTITGVFPTVWGVDQEQFSFTPSISTYALPAEAENVLSVTADLNGPSQEQQRIHRYSFSGVAPTDDWADGKTITLEEPVTPGKTVTVTYTKAPSALSADGDLLTASGLRETARLLVVYGACSELVSFMDIARLPADTAQADEFTERNQVGMASRISGQLYLRYQQELAAEQKRLQQTTPPVIRMRKR